MPPVERPIDESQVDLCVNALGYEIETLIALESVTEKFGRSGPAIVYHACLEAALLHARTVVEFLAGRRDGDAWFDKDLQPLDLLPEWPNNDPWELRRHLKLIDPHLSHLSLERGVIADDNDWLLEEIIEDIVMVLREFLSALEAVGSEHAATIALAMRDISDPPVVPPLSRPRRGSLSQLEIRRSSSMESRLKRKAQMLATTSFNEGFYATAATVIPVLAIALLFTGGPLRPWAIWVKRWKYHKLKPLLDERPKGRFWSVRATGIERLADVLQMVTSLVLLAASVGEASAFLALDHRFATPAEHQYVLWSVIGLPFIAAAAAMLSINHESIKQLSAEQEEPQRAEPSDGENAQ